MAWEKFKVEEQRLQVIEAYINGDASMTAICERYGISTKTAYKWYKRYLSLGMDGLNDLSQLISHIVYILQNKYKELLI